MRSLALLIPLAVTACDFPVKKPTGVNETANDTGIGPMPKATTCADGWTVRLDDPSFRAANVPAHRLDTFAVETARSAAEAANSACRDFLDADKARMVREVTIVDVPGESGAPLFRASEDGRTIRVEWSFAEHDLAIPSDVEWRAGLSCAIDANAQGCGGDGEGEIGQ